MVKKVVLLILFTSSLLAGNLSKDKQWGAGVSLLFPALIGSYFNHEDAYEIDVPITYYAGNTDDDKTRFDVFTMDVHVRHYLSKEIGGWYLSGFGRFTYIDGELGEYTSFLGTTKENQGRVKVSKLGIGVGAGYKVFNLFGNESAYWGMGINVGGYVLGKSEMVQGLFFDDVPVILNLELLKFGYAF